jgi:glycosyltransferase involved in cell wall biosynthesis
MAMTIEIGPLVSILIPCYNAEQWVGDAIRSALAQTYEPKEVIVVDDGSTDGSLEVIRSFGEAIRSESGPNRGACEARNRLTALSRGEWLQYLDADDYLLPEKITTQMRVARCETCDLVASPWLREGGCVIDDLPSKDPWTDFLGHSEHLGNTITNLWRKHAVEATGGWNPSKPFNQEVELILRMLKSGARVAYCSTSMAVARSVNPCSITNRRDLTLAWRSCLALVEDAVGFLRVSGQLTPGRRAAAAQTCLRAARYLWRLGDPSWRHAERLANQIEPDIKKALHSSTHVYGRVYSLLGFRPAERYLQCSARLKRGIAKLKQIATVGSRKKRKCR